MFKKPIILRAPRPAGSAVESRYFAYEGNLEAIKELATDEVPVWNGVDDGGNTYKVPVENGWLLDFVLCSGVRRTWALFAIDDGLFLDVGGTILSWQKEVKDVRVRVYWIAARVILRMTSPETVIDIWIRFPWYRTLFLGGQSRIEECEPICDILSELSHVSGVELWKARWLSGFSVRNKFIVPVRTELKGPGSK